MKKFLLASSVAVLMIACNKKNDSACTPVPPSSEASAISGFCTSNGINATVDSNGIYYQIIDPGSGARPTMNSTITVTYTASLLDETVIDDHSSNPITQPLGSFIEGWIIAIPYIQQGGHIKMIIPSSLAYGCTGSQGIVPPNSPLYFDVVLTAVSN